MRVSILPRYRLDCHPQLERTLPLKSRLAGPGIEYLDRRLWPARAAFLLAKPKRDSQMLERIDRGVGKGRETLIYTHA